jgi:hypothetical protein
MIDIFINGVKCFLSRVEPVVNSLSPASTVWYVKFKTSLLKDQFCRYPRWVSLNSSVDSRYDGRRLCIICSDNFEVVVKKKGGYDNNDFVESTPSKSHYL